MPNPLTHIGFNLLVFYFIDKRIKLGYYWPFFAILSGLIPDFDFIFNILSNMFNYDFGILSHGGIFHSFTIYIFLVIFAYVLSFYNLNYSNYIFILGFGGFLHVFLDLILGGGAKFLYLFFPFLNLGFRIHILDFGLSDIYAILDAFVIILFLINYKVVCSSINNYYKKYSHNFKFV